MGAILRECTDMPPRAADVLTATGLPVHDIHSPIGRFRASLRSRRFG